MRKFFTYENKMLVLLFLTFGLVFMDKLSFTFLMPDIAKDLGFTNAQSGDVIGIISVFFGISTLVFSLVSDFIGSKKKMLVAFVTLFSFATLSVLWIEDFNSMLVIRAFMGITEGPVVPLILATVLAFSTESRRGANLGLIQGSAPLMSGVFAPMLLIPIAMIYDWRTGFLALAIPGFILAILIGLFLKEPELQGKEEKKSMADLMNVFKNRNIILCLLMTIFFMVNLMSFVGFAPLFWENYRGIPKGETTLMLTAFGVGSFLWFFIIPTLSDRFGRKPTLVFFAAISFALPLFMATSNFGSIATSLCILVLTFSTGFMPLVNTIIPSESVPHKFAATAMAACILAGEVIGGAIGPMLCGRMADMYDLRAPFFVGIGAAVICFLLSLGIKEII